ncbi:MAG: hypothetical protein L0099_11540, partial [Acidobacteria bacterium]|nr:hypothetical protein [Acidobacteriota bacterium]
MVTSWILSRKDYDLGQLAAPVADLFLRGVAAPRRAHETRPALAAVAPQRGGRAGSVPTQVHLSFTVTLWPNSADLAFL